MSMIRSIFIIFAAFLYMGSAYAEEKTVFLSKKELEPHEKTITRVENYLTRLDTLVSEFTQVAPDGALATGKFYLQRPGKMRWQYNPPVPVLMVADGRQLIYYDYELEQISYIPLSGSLISFLTRDPIRFSGEVGITYFYAEAKMVRIEVAQKDTPKDGRLMLELSDYPLQLRSMVITDAQGQVTTVSLNNATFGAKIKPALFIFKDPRKKRRGF